MEGRRLCPYCGGELHESSAVCLNCVRPVNGRERVEITPKRRANTAYIKITAAAAAAALMLAAAVFVLPKLLRGRPGQAAPAEITAASESAETSPTESRPPAAATKKSVTETTTHTTTTKATASTTKKSVTTTKIGTTTGKTTPSLPAAAESEPTIATTAQTSAETLYVSLVYVTAPETIAPPETAAATTKKTTTGTTTPTTTTTKFTLEEPEQELYLAIKSEPALKAFHSAQLHPTLCRRAEDRCRQIESCFKAGTLPSGTEEPTWLRFIYSHSEPLITRQEVISDWSYEIIAKGCTSADELLYSEKENYPGLVTYLNNNAVLGVELGPNIDVKMIGAYGSGEETYKVNDLTKANSRQQYIGIAKVGDYWVIITIAD
ncbi:MAG: hypothetical protein IJ746_07845 [Ruminococcus sp.]|nr:hypothetical protein [Ruminococcus sp.]